MKDLLKKLARALSLDRSKLRLGTSGRDLRHRTALRTYDTVPCLISDCLASSYVRCRFQLFMLKPCLLSDSISVDVLTNLSVVPFAWYARSCRWHVAVSVCPRHCTTSCQASQLQHVYRWHSSLWWSYSKAGRHSLVSRYNSEAPFVSARICLFDDLTTSETFLSGTSHHII